ncbi:glycerol-3-phosphate dehydrogenase/oxidase [Shewanella sp. UCD-KL12]|uniref:glycerol-3-phosphate dehydrogenase/oxidase n=1 Tax=Shewanella sp. UCD-KL12 TaxID=1917163 RepID=UPI0009708727|nr:FAD-dependent oxidoreductase [Shewanella sp. UCD-KL12]
MDSVDILIIGGGINGAGIAQCASAAGYSVVLLEKDEIGQQTSANSSKLIHGGLRYLESGQLSLVKQSLIERRTLLRLAPDLVKATPFYIPIYQDSKRSQWAIRAGLSAYSLLSEFDRLGRFRSLPPEQWSQIAGLKLKGLEAVFQYWDAQTDDRALTQAVIRSAESLGAKILTQVECNTIVHKPNACEVKYSQKGERVTLTAACVINAAGPWVNQVSELVQPPVPNASIELVQGSHLLLDIPGPDGILYLESCFDERVIFVMPWKGKTLLGTTEVTLEHLEGKPKMTREERYYLLGIYCHYFPQYENIEVLDAQVLQTFCGVRVLPKTSGSAFERSREVLLQKSMTHPRLMTVLGGKLTTFRATSKEAVDWVKLQLGERESIANIDKLPLY